MDCEQVEEQLEAYLLGWLDDAQTQEIEAHLDDCPSCRQAYQEMAETLALLPTALAHYSSLELPPALKDQVVAQVPANPQAEPARDADAVLETAAGPSDPPASPAQTLAASGPQRSGRSSGARGYRWAFALATLLLAITILWGIRLNVVLARERALRIEFGELVDQQEVVLEVIDSNQTTRRVLLPPDYSPGGEPGPYGKVFTRADMPYVVAMVGRLPEPPAGSVYYLWLITEDGPRLAGEMYPNEEGFALLIYEAAVDGPNFVQTLITRQAPGASAPSEPPVLIWPQESQ